MNIIGLIAPPLIGGVFGLVAMFGLVSSQTAGPDQNPAQQAPITYGQ